MRPPRNCFRFCLFVLMASISWGKFWPLTRVPSIRLLRTLLFMSMLSLVNQIYSWFSRISGFSKERLPTVQQVMLNSFFPSSLFLVLLSFHLPCSSGLTSSEIVERAGRRKEEGNHVSMYK